MKSDEKPSTDITRREALKKLGKLGLYVPPTLAVLTTAPRAFAGSPADVTISGTFFLSTITGFPYGWGVPFCPTMHSITLWCGPDGSTFSAALRGLDPTTQDWHIEVWLSSVSDCFTGTWDVLWTLLASGPDAHKGTVSGQEWRVPGGAVAPGEALQVNFTITT